MEEEKLPEAVADFGTKENFDCRCFRFTAAPEQLRKPRKVRLGLIQHQIQKPTIAPVIEQVLVELNFASEFFWVLGNWIPGRKNGWRSCKIRSQCYLLPGSMAYKFSRMSAVIASRYAFCLLHSGTLSVGWVCCGSWKRPCLRLLFPGKLWHISCVCSFHLDIKNPQHGRRFSHPWKRHQPRWCHMEHRRFHKKNIFDFTSTFFQWFSETMEILSESHAKTTFLVLEILMSLLITWKARWVIQYLKLHLVNLFWLHISTFNPKKIKIGKIGINICYGRHHPLNWMVSTNIKCLYCSLYSR